MSHPIKDWVAGSARGAKFSLCRVVMNQGKITVDVVRKTPIDLLGALTDVERKHAPQALFLVGDLNLLTVGPRVSVVGSRKATPEGLRRARMLAKALVEHHMIVVSGLAEGVDTVAHQAAIEAGGRTIAVLGTPLDQSYPTGNAELQALIGREHLLVSQFPSGCQCRTDIAHFWRAKIAHCRSFSGRSAWTDGCA